MQNIAIIFTLFFLLPFLFFAFKKPDHAFWLSLMLYFDPGGIFAGYFGGDIFWRIKSYDVFFALMLLIFLTSNKKEFFRDQGRRFLVILTLLILISLYFLFVTGILVPMAYNYTNFPFFIQKNRQFFYSVPLFLMVYFFTYRSVHIFYKQLVWFAAIILSAYFLTLLTGLKIIPVMTSSRFEINDRIYMISYGLIHWVLILGLIYLFSGRKYKPPLSGILVYSTILMFLTLILTLTRREFFRIVFMVAAIPVILSMITQSSIIIKIQKILIPASFTVFALYIIFPAYIGKSKSLLTDSYSIMTTGRTQEGEEDYRITGTGDLLIVKDIIRQNPFLGIGFYPAQWDDIIVMQKSGNKLGFALDASSEVPVYGAVMRLGLLGLIIPAILYIILLKISWEILLFLRRNRFKAIIPVSDYILMICLLYFVLAKFTIEIFQIFGEFYVPQQFPLLCLTIGMLLGLYKRNNRNIVKETV